LSNPFLVILLAGLGNAFFHIGGGGLSLNIETNKAFFPGIFVAPGALGLTLGILLGNSGYLTYWPFILLLLISIVFIIIKKIPSINYQKVSIKREVNYFNFILLGLFFSICIRSLYGVTAVFDWKSNIILLVISTVFVVIGKFLGGFLADKYGWIKITTIVLLISAPILSFYKEIPFLAILGGCFFQMTMPMTLVGVSNLLPGRPATSFGLTTFALILGAMPLYLGWKNLFYGSFISLLLISISAVLLLFSFKLGFNYLKKKQKINL
jgi:FSR family fosmidomycin resistance protein-like MFS transporter